MKTHIWTQTVATRPYVSFRSAVVQRHLAFTLSSIPPRVSVDECMSPALDQLTLSFAMHMRASPSRGLDIGCGHGIATAAALARGGSVTAIDPDLEALRRLVARVPPEQFPRLRIRLAALPACDFKAANFSAVHVSRVLHLLSPENLQISLRKFFRWLYPNGKLFVSALSPVGEFWKPLRVAYCRRALLGEPWPGYLQDTHAGMPDCKIARPSVHLLDEDVMGREVAAAGFVLEELTSYTLPWDEQQVCTAVVARCIR
jgi:SAM-dependent methyltransferase